MDTLSHTTVFNADWNTFGYDPTGLLAHLVACFFGLWTPDTFDHLPQWEGEVHPPRYGPPSPQQFKQLPVGWTPTAPPLYYGEPSGPYLPPPRKFRPSAFASLMSSHPRAPLILTGKPKERKAESFYFTIRYRRRGQVHYFRELSDINWWAFRRTVCKHLGVKPVKARLAYRQFHDVLQGSFCQLRGTKDWDLAISKLLQADEENSSTELEVMEACTLLKSSRGRSQLCLRLQSPVIANLSNRSIFIETYSFQYPTVQDLLKLLSDDSGVFASGWSLKGLNLQDVLKRAGLENMDDFCLTSPLALHISSGIPAGAVTSLYIAAEKLIHLIHRKMAGEIREVREMRDEYARIREYRISTGGYEVS